MQCEIREWIPFERQKNVWDYNVTMIVCMRRNDSGMIVRKACFLPYLLFLSLYTHKSVSQSPSRHNVWIVGKCEPLDSHSVSGASR